MKRITLKRGKGKRAVSPVISTVLLILIVIILATIILLWSRGFIKEVILKEIAGESKRIEQFCAEVKLEGIVNPSGSFGFYNVGNVPIYAVSLKLTGRDTGKSEIITIKPEDGGSVNPSFSLVIEDQGDYDDYEEVKIIPILLGKSKSGGIKEKECPEENALIL